MTTGTDSVASFATTVHGVLQHLATTSGFPAWVLMRADERGDQPLAVADPAGVLRPSDPTATRSGSELPRIDVAVMLPTGRTFGRLVGTGDHESAEVATAPATEAANLFASLLGLLIGSDLALAAERRAAEARDGTTDPLTGLATRQGWELRKRLDDRICREYGEPAAVLLIELDELKRNNERYGHSAGDEQLRTAGALVREALAGAHFGARITGDRLGVLIVGADERQVGELERAVRRALSAAQISAVIGVGSRTAGAFASVEAANAEAEAEVERTHSVRHVSMGDSDVNASLLDAMANGAIKAYFQPIVDLRTGEVVAVEALARWQAADSMREPDQFLPALQQAGLLGALFDRILDDGLHKLVGFRGINPHLQLAVNFEFDTKPGQTLFDTITERLNRYGLPASALSLELSERQTFELPTEVREELEAVADLGVQLMLDDFGTGFASLETLTTLPISGVKLDRRFTGQVVNGERESIVVKAMIALAAESGLTVIAEGIETQAQCDRLVRMGCRLGQGYLFAVPQPAESVSTVLSAPLVSTF